MDNKPLLTYLDDQQDLFLRLLPYINRGLPRESILWKRSYGRPSRNMTISVNFVPFNFKTLPKADSWYLSTYPFLHTFWVASDIDAYKNSTKDQLNDWLNHLKEKEICDWLIIVLTNDDNQLKNKILRTSVYDRVKNDFCNKVPDRCILFPEPFRSDSKSSDAWNLVLSRLRGLLLESYDRHLSRFDEFMRVQRERRIDPNWSFTGYFLLQEELALTYEMLGLYEDALIQYDELDALFTQFILNYSAGGEHAPWLLAMKNTQVLRWDGVYLNQSIDLHRKRLITSSCVSLLDLRTYHLSRVSFLLLALNRLDELEQRAQLYLHNCIREFNILELDLPEGATAGWINLSCLEILKFCRAGCPNNSIQNYNVNSSNLLDYARLKTKELGEICGLMSNDDALPNSAQLMKTVDILSGFTNPDGEPENLTKLREALSSKLQFQRYYLDLSEQSMCALKHIGRRRTAKLIGKDLADYYIVFGDYKKAELHLVDAMKTYKFEGWEMLAHHTRRQLAKCQKELFLWKKYCRTCLYLSTSKVFSADVQRYYQNEILNINTKAVVQQLRCYPAFFVNNVKVVTEHPSQGQSCIFSFSIASHLVDPISVDDVKIVLRHLEDHQEPSSFDLFSLKTLSRQLSNLSGQSTSFLNVNAPTETVDIDGRCEDNSSKEFLSPKKSRDSNLSKVQDGEHKSPEEANAQKNKKTLLTMNISGHDGLLRKKSDHSILSGVELFNKIRESIEYSFQPVNFVSDVGTDKSGLNVSSRILCKTPLKRMNSVPLSEDLAFKTSDERNESFSVFKLGAPTTIQPGSNHYEISGKFEKVGRYVVQSVIIVYNYLDFVDHLKNEQIHFKVLPTELDVNISFANAHPIAGLIQNVHLEIKSKEAEETLLSDIEITSSSNIILSSKLLNDNGKYLSGDVSLKDAQPFSIDMNLLPYNDPLHSLDYYLIVKLNGYDAKLYKLNLAESLMANHSVLTSFSRKFIQLSVRNMSVCKFLLKDWFLVDENNSLQLSSYNDHLCQPTIIYSKQSCSFVWELHNANKLKSEAATLQFSLKFNYEQDQCEQFGIYTYHFQLLDIETHYDINVSNNSNNMIKYDDTIIFNIKISSTLPNLIPLFYKVCIDETLWQVTGNLHSDIIFKDNFFEFDLKAKPLQIGSLAAPTVSLLTLKKFDQIYGSYPLDATRRSSSSSSATSPSSPPHSTSNTIRSSISSADLYPELQPIDPVNIFIRAPRIIRVLHDQPFATACSRLLINLEEKTTTVMIS